VGQPQRPRGGGGWDETQGATLTARGNTRAGEAGISASRRLNSWKEIAAYFGKDERTVKRWEVSRGLPVRRIPGGAKTSVFAYVEELDGWLTGKATTTAPKVGNPAVPISRRPTWMGPAITAGVVIVFGSGLAYLSAQAQTHPSVQHVAARHEPPQAAQALYLLGSYQWNTRTGDGISRAIDAFTQAIAMDDDYAEAHAGLAIAYNLISQYTDAPSAPAYARAKTEGERAVALDPRLAIGYAALGFAAFYGDHAFTRSAELFERAVALDPNAAQTLHWYALTAMHMGSFQRPVEMIDRAQRLDPQSRSILANKALILFHAGRTPEALGLLQDLEAHEPGFLPAKEYLATIYLDQQRYADFLDEYQATAEITGEAARQAIATAARRGFALSGSVGMFRAMLEEQRRQYALGREPAYKLAVTAASMGDGPTALDYLTIAVERQEADVLGMRIEPAFRLLYQDDSFAELLKKVGLPVPGGA
jgi:tetratricopeptide (TPR) repeat protein